jgi:hypothetical protein
VDEWAIEDFVVDNDGRPPRDVAARMPQLAGWL